MNKKFKQILLIILMSSMVLSSGGFLDLITLGGTVYASGGDKAAAAIEEESSGSSVQEESASGDAKGSDTSAEKAGDNSGASESDTSKASGEQSSDKSGKADDSEKSDKADAKSDDAAQGNTDKANADGTKAQDSKAAKDKAADKDSTNKNKDKIKLKYQKLKLTPVQAPLYKTDSKNKKASAEVRRVRRFWESLTGRKVKAEDNDKTGSKAPVKLVIAGDLPKGATAEATYIEYDEKDIYNEQILTAFDITIRDKDGKVYIPETPVSITVKGRAVESATDDGAAVLIYSCVPDKERTASYKEKYGIKYAADVLVYRDGTGDDARREYKVYKKNKTYKDGKDAVRYREDKAGLSYDDESTIVFDYTYGKNTGKQAKAKDTDGTLHFVMSQQLPQEVIDANLEAKAAAEAETAADTAKEEVADSESADGESAGKDAKDAEIAYDEGTEDGWIVDDLEEDDDAETADTAETADAEKSGSGSDKAAEEDAEEAKSGEDKADAADKNKDAKAGESADKKDSDTAETAEASKDTKAEDGIENETEDGREEDKEEAGKDEETKEAEEAAESGAVSEEPASSAKTKKVERTATDGKTYRVTATYDTDSGIPDNAELVVKEIRKGEFGYKSYVNRSAEEVGKDPKELGFVKLLDISFKDPITGLEYQPDDKVIVNIELLKNDVSESSDVDVVHFGDKKVEVMDSEVKDGAVEFEAEGFSVYVVIGSGGETVTPQCTYTFYVPDPDRPGEYKEYAFKDSQGQTIYKQTITSGEELVVPQLTSTDTEVFAGWYENVTDGAGGFKLAESPYDFDNIKITENSAVSLYAVFKEYANVYFHGQYDSTSKTFPVSSTVRAELVTTTEGATTTKSATVDISDVNTSYSGTGSTKMDFIGWSRTPISTPGSATDDNGEPVEAISTDSITITGETHLYPIYKTIHWLTYYAAQSGLSASYVAPASFYTGDPVTYDGDNSLPTTSRDGYTFQGWWTGTLSKSGSTETVNYGTQITNADGSLVTAADDGGVYISGSKLYLRADATLYAKWQATYNIVYWKQKTSESPSTENKTYEYAETITKTAAIGNTVSVEASDRATDRYIGYSLGRYDASATIGNTKELTVLNVYYDLSSSYTPTEGGSYTLTFADSVTGSGASTMPPAVTGLSYGASLTDSIPPNPTSSRTSDSGRTIYNFDRWYADEAATIPVFFKTPTAEETKSLDDYVVYDTMPDHDLTVYAGWTPIKFKVDIDPNYGALYYYDDEGVLQGSGATYFNNTYDAEPIGEYTHATRDYVESTSGTYFYVNHDRAYGGADRFTYYTTKQSEATEDTTFEYSPGTYTYAGWYEVYSDGSEASEPYDFSQHTDHATTLRLHWKKSGAYYLKYNAVVDGLSGTMDDAYASTELFADGNYADYAEITLNHSAIAPTGYTFVGWKVRGSDSTTIYRTGQNFILHADDAIRTSGKEVVFLDAVFTRVDTASITYDANGGTIDGSTIDYGKIPKTFGEDVDAPGSYDTDASTATVSGLANNSKFILSSGAGFSYTDGDVTYTLAGWSNKAVYDPDDTDAKLYTLGGTYGVDSKDPTTLYAVWQTKITYHLNNSTANWGGTGADGAWESPYISETVDSEAVYTMNTYLGNTVDEPTYIPEYTGTDNKLFRYWATKSTDDGNDTYTEYDFTQAVTGAPDLYAYWSEPNTITVHAVDASTATMSEIASGTEGWTINPVTVGTTSIALPGSDILTTPSDYEIAFVAAHDKTKDVNTITKEEAVTAIIYNSAKKGIYVTYQGGHRAELRDGIELYYVCYQKETLNIGYKSMAASGELTDVQATGATSTTDALGAYDMQSQITTPLSLVSGFSNYAFAIGNANAANASALNMMTDPSDSNDNRPALKIRNTWKGFEYSEDGNNWVSCGYNPTLYVIYFEQKPTTIIFKEKTVGSSSIMNIGFTYNVTVTQTVTDGSGNETTTTLFDTTSASTGQSYHGDPYTLKNGEEQSAILFYDANTTQTITITQTADDDFDTAVASESGTAPQPNVWTYTSDGSGGTQTVTFTNTHKALPVEVHVAMVNSDGIAIQDDLRSNTAANYSFDLALGAEAVSLTTKLPSNNLFAGDETHTLNDYAFGAVVYGTSLLTDGSTVTVDGMSAAKIAYEKVDGNVYELVLRDSSGKKLGELGRNKLYYLYYPMPKIRYMKADAEGNLTQIKGSVKDPVTGSIVASDSITYDHGIVTMNGQTVAYDQSIEIPLNGLTISQSGNNFRMPAVLDDGLYERYLSYVKIGAGNENAQNTSALGDRGVSDSRTMQLKVQNNTLQYSFDGDSWIDFPLSGTPTIYAIYSERGYDLQISKTIDMSQSGNKPIFADSSFNVTIRSAAITKKSYEAEGADSSTINATPADGDTQGTISFFVEDGTKIRIKGLGRGDYTITESGNENYTLTARTGSIIGNSTSPMTVTGNTAVSFTLDAEKKVDLTNSPKAICRIDDHYFYTLRSMVEYVDSEIATKTATAEMLTDYLMPKADTVEIPSDFNLTLTTAESVGHVAEITRTSDLASVPLFTNKGALTLTNLTLEGSSIEATAPMIRSAGDLTIGSIDSGTIIQNAVGGGAIKASAGNITVSGTIQNCSADRGGAIYHSGNSTITLNGTGTIQNNTATSGDGGAIWLGGGTVKLSGTSKITGNKAESGNGGAVYCHGTVVIKLDQGGSITGNIAKEGGAIYAENGTISISKTVEDENVNPAITGNTATSGNGGAIHVGAGSVSVSGGSVSNNKAVNGLGGAIYANAASVTVSGTVEVKTNTAIEGGAVYAVSGAVEVSGGTVDNNTATTGNGGAIYAGSGHVTLSGGSIGNNTSTAGRGGAIYTGTGNVILSDGASLSDNTAKTDGGAVYAGGGSVTVSCDSLSGNTATEGKGGAVYAESGAVAFTGVAVSGNTAGSDGGAVYAGSGAVSMTGGSMTKNTSTSGNGGALYAGSGSVALDGVTFGGTDSETGDSLGNTATAGSGGAVYAGSGIVTLTNTVTMTYNTAGTNGGALYVSNGSASLASTTSMTNNSAVNGAAIFIDSGRATFTGGTYTANTASEGGAIGMGRSDARLYFSGDVNISGNTLTDGTTKNNIYLDQDSKDVLNMAGLGSGASLGIYVPDSTTSKRDVPGARFATYTNDSNVTTKISNDRRGFSVQKDEDAKQLFWGAKIKVEVRYQKSFAANIPPTSVEGTGDTNYQVKKAAFDYYPEFDSAAVSELADEIKNKNTLGLSSTAVYAIGFAGDAAQYSDYVTNLDWNDASEAWELKKRDGTTEELNDRTILIYYAEPAYVAIENNTDSALEISSLTVGNTTIGQLSVINTDSNAGYGTVYARNGSVRSALLPVTEDDLKLPANAAITLLLPGGQGMTYNFDGTFVSIASDTVRLRRGTATTPPEETLTVNAHGSFETLTGSTPSSNITYKIIFGDDRYVCKVVDSAGEEHRYTSISGAISDVVNTTTENPPYTLETAKTAAVEMLVDYLLPSSDAVVVPAGYDITFTTATTGNYKYEPVDESEPRATISRDTDNTNAMVSTTTGSTATALTIKDLVFNVKGVQGSTEYGALVANGSAVTVDNVDFTDLYANNGGAIFAQTTSGNSNSWVKVTNSYFYNCHSIRGGSRDGGGAIHAYVDRLEVEGCQFDSCEGNWQAGAVFHRVEYTNNYTESLVTNCTFINCQSKAAGGMELGGRNIIVKGCTFEHCYATSRNGGGFNVYIMTSNTGGGAPNFDCWTRVEDCTFNDCGLTSAGGANDGNGGGFRSSSKYTTVVNTTFTNCTSLRNGGAIALSNGNAIKAELYGVTISGCSAVTGGGIHAQCKQLVISDSYDVDANGNPIFANGTAKAPGGTDLSSGAAAGTHFVAEMKVENCSATTVGGIFHDKDDNNATLTITNATITGNTATGSAGGGVSSKARTVTMTGSTITHNSAKGTGGGLNASKTTKLDLKDSTTISNNTATGNGGGVWTDTAALVLTVTGCTMDGNTAGDSGGAVYTPAKTVTVTDSQITNCTAAKSAGGIYQGQNSDGSSMTITGSGIISCKANNGSGGGIWSNVRELSITDSEVSKNSATNTGGGIYYDGPNDATRALMVLAVSGCTIDSNTSNNNGGGIYTAAKTVNAVSYTYPEGEAPTSAPAVGSYITDSTGAITGRRTEISNCKGTNGGGIWHSNNTNNIVDSSLAVTETTVTGCSATNGIGGGIYANVYYATFTDSEVSGNTASGNGGGIYKAKQNNAYYLIIDDSDVKNNTSGNRGGGVYCQSQLYLRNNIEISGNRLTSSTVDNAAGVFLEDNRTLYMGPMFTDATEAAAFTDSSSIKENYTASGADSNLRLWWASGQNATASVYVYCNLDGMIGVTNAAKVGTQFGTSLITNPNGFEDDDAVFQADTSTLHGIIDRTDESGTKIIWAGPPIAKITGKDADGNDILLYLKNNGTGPAIFDKLNAGNNNNYGTSSAFGILNTASPTLYTKDGTLYEGKTYSIKMLVESYTSEVYLIANYYEGRNLIFTTAGKTDTDGYPYEGRAGGRATVTRGTGTGNNNFLNANCNLTLTNIIIDGGSENGIAANSNTRVLNINNANAKVTLGENAVLQNASASNEGGGVNISNGMLEINGGVIRNCSTTKDGGGVYVNGGQLLLEAGSIYQCSANASGGGVRVKNGSVTMSGGTISECSAVTGSGGGVYLGGGKVLNMSGGSIINNYAKKAGGGIVVYDANARLYFSGKVNISGNTCEASVAANNACNVELNQNSKAVINTNNGGLYAGSYIGVYVPGNDNTNPYKEYGGERDNFGTFADNDNTTTFYSFVNDRNGLKGGIIENPSPNTIYWIQIFSLEVSKEVVSGSSTTVDPDEPFLFKVNVRGDANVTGQLNAAQIDSEDGEYGEMHFDSNGRDTTTAVFALKDGESITGVNLSEGLTYEVIEYLTVDQADRYAAMPMNGYNLTTESLTYDGTTYPVIKANTYTSTIGENKSRSDVDPYTSSLTFTNLMPVCKITDMSGNLLYRRYDWDKVTNKTGEGQDGGSSTNQPYYYAPAVYTELTGNDGAFKALEGTLYRSNDSNPISYSVSNGVQIQMLIGDYSLNEAVTANTGKIILTTASSEDTLFPKQDAGTTSTIRRAFAGGSMFSVSGDLTVATVIIDGVKSTYTIAANGGIISVENGGSLTVQDGATLQNSRTAEGYSGGAVYVASGGAVTMTGGSVNHNESVGNGAGIYLNEGSTLNLSGAPNFGGTGVNAFDTAFNESGNLKTGALPLGTKNGCKNYDYSRARQDIYIAGYASTSDEDTSAASLVIDGNITSGDGTIWVWAEDSPHYKTLKQFAKYTSDVTDTATSFAAFRNARPDSDTGATGSYLYGITKDDDTGKNIYWYGVEGSRKVILRKVSNNYAPLAGAVFKIHKESSTGSLVKISIDGSDIDTFTSDDSGVYFIGELNYGTYYVEETVAPQGYTKPENKFFIITVNKDGVGYSEDSGTTFKKEVEAK